MKRFPAILFFSVYLVSATECYQFIKVPLLIKHFIEHKEGNRNMTFLQFLSIHYSDKTVYDEDYQEDQKLPFKSLDNFVMGSIPAVVTNVNQELVIKISFSEITTTASQPKGFLLKTCLSAIWQPPKTC